MTSDGRIVTFTNLFPSSARPTFGLFVRERMRRVIAATGYEWHVVCPVARVPWPLSRLGAWNMPELPEQEEQPEHGVTVHHVRYLHLPGMSLAAQARRMARAARPIVARLCGDGPAVLDAHYVYPDGVAALTIAGELGVPCFVTARGTDVNVIAELPVVRRQLQAALRHATRLFAVSEPLRRKFAALAGGDDRVELSRNGVDFERFQPGDRAAARRALGLPADVALVCGVGRLAENKGFHHMVKALRGLPKQVHFAIAGDGPMRAELKAQAPAGRLHLLGSQPPDRVAELYRAADLMVLPSAREGWPNVVTEALASGLRVVATPVGAIPEMLGSPLVGSLVRAEDAGGLRSEVERLLRSPYDRTSVRDYARRFSWDEPIERLAAAFRRAMP